MKLHALICIATLIKAAIAILDHCIVDDALVPCQGQGFWNSTSHGDHRIRGRPRHESTQVGLQ